jgi:hypothetical protein
MPNSYGMPTLLDIAKLNGTDGTVGLIEEVIRVSPEVDMGYARTIKGLNYRARVRTTLPTVSFRGVNQGSKPSASTYENRLYEAFIMNPKWFCDKADADAFEDGAPVYIAMEGVGMMEAAMLALSKQFYYGAGAAGGSVGDASGFPGLCDVVDAGMCIDNGGTTLGTGAGTAISTSVWAVRFGIRDTSWIYGNNGQLLLSPVTEIPNFQDPNDATKYFTAYHQEIMCRPGLQVASKWSCGRVANVTADAGKGLTDKVLGALKALFPPQQQPHAYFCTVQAREQLRASRTATNPTGTPAPTPTDFEGVPVLATTGILNTEAILT